MRSKNHPVKSLSLLIRKFLQAPREKEPMLPGRFLDLDDYTYYVNTNGDPREDDLVNFSYKYRDLLLNERFSNNTFSASCQGKIHSCKELKPSPRGSNSGRLLVCKCFAGEAIAVTARRLEKPSEAVVFEDRKRPETWDPVKCGYVKNLSPTEVPFAVSIETVCEQFDNLFLGLETLSGLILVSGSTNSAKSELTRGIIERLIRKDLKKNRKRWPHLVTYEDPIEKRLFKDPKTALSYGVEYTPREKGIDVCSLSDAFDDALRQTPSVFYVGEIRKDQEWKELMRFAGTGHLVIATSHAGSLVEAMERIFHGMEAKTAAERGQVAGRVLAVIHQRKFDLSSAMRKKLRQLPGEYDGCLSEDFKFEVLLPTIWRRTPAGVAALVSDGLGSLLPNRPSSPDTMHGASSIGRQYFAEELRKQKRWQDICLVDFLGTRIKVALEANAGHLLSDELELWTSLLGKDRGWRIYIAFAYLIVRLWRRESDSLGEELIPGALKNVCTTLDSSPDLTELVTAAFSGGRIELQKEVELAYGKVLVNWLRKTLLTIVNDHEAMVRIVRDSIYAEDKGARAIFQAEAIRLDLMGD